MRAPDCAGQRASLNEIEMKTETETETDERRIEAKDQGFWKSDKVSSISYYLLVIIKS